MKRPNGWMIVGVACVVWIGCQSAPAPIPTDASTPGESVGNGDPSTTQTALEARDAEMLCSRIAARSVAAWTQPVYASERGWALALRVDQQEPGAYADIAAWMRAHQDRAPSCTDALIDQIASNDD